MGGATSGHRATLATLTPRSRIPPYSERVFPTSLSPSRANDFLTCPLLYRLRVIDRLPEEPSAAAVRGTLVHGALEDLFGANPAERTVESAVGYFARRWEILQQEKPQDAAALLEGVKVDAESAEAVANAIVAPARSLLETYFQLEDPRRLEPHALEMSVSVEMESGLALRGYIDRVDRSAQGLVRLVDYKTGRSPGQGFEAKALFQMRFYALLWWRINGDVPARLELLYLGDGQRLAYEPGTEELLATERKITAIASAISSAARSEQGFASSPSALCGWCSFKEFCPSFDGTPPPMPELPGVSA